MVVICVTVIAEGAFLGGGRVESMDVTLDVSLLKCVLSVNVDSSTLFEVSFAVSLMVEVRDVVLIQTPGAVTNSQVTSISVSAVIVGKGIVATGFGLN